MPRHLIGNFADLRIVIFAVISMGLVFLGVRTAVR
jgi:hypothetical protein